VTPVSGSGLLFVSQVAPYADGPAGVHGVLDQAAVGVTQIADIHGLRAERVDDVRDLADEALADARVLALFTIGETPWSETQRTVILDGLRRGELAVLAIHSATDASYGWPEYGQIVGARFDGHPWTETVDLDVVQPDHPATQHLGATWRWRDEVYQFRDLRADAHVLLRVPDAALDLDAPGAGRPDFGFPLSWCFEEGRGRTFSTSLGHFPGAWESTDYLRHLSGGLQWALESNG
jgi:type 1 glutamine amidotransferase